MVVVKICKDRSRGGGSHPSVDAAAVVQALLVVRGLSPVTALEVVAVPALVRCHPRMMAGRRVNAARLSGIGGQRSGARQRRQGQGNKRRGKSKSTKHVIAFPLINGSQCLPMLHA